MNRILLIILCCAVISAKPTSGPSSTRSTTTTNEARYRVYFDTDRAGLTQNLTVTITYQRDRVLRRNETVTRSDDQAFTLEFDGTVQVLAAQRGEATKLSVSVDHFTKNEDGKTEEILPAGSVVIVESGGKQPKYSLKDGSGGIGEIDRRKLLYVQILVSTQREGEPSTQDIYGSSSPQPIGATWPVSIRQMARSYARQSIKIDAERSFGETRIVALEPRDGATYAHVQSDARIQTKVPVANGWKQTFGEDRIGFAVLAPTDPAGTTLDSSSFYESTTKYLRYVGRNETEREVSEEHVLRFREVKVKGEIRNPKHEIRNKPE